MKKILLVEDNDTIVMGLKKKKKKEGFQFSSVKTIQETVEIMGKENIDLILLDINLPDGNGFDICSKLKEKEDVPIIFLTARDDEKDIVKGLDIGADDYITKPFRNRELISRINNVLRRYGKSDTNVKENVIKLNDIEINKDSAKVMKDGKEIVFTSLEYKILVMMFSNPNVLITREQILDKIWDIAGNFVNDNTLTVYIKRIREKLDDKEGKIIKTVRGLGYIIEESK